MYDGPYDSLEEKKTVRVPITPDGKLKDVSVGDEVTIVLKGKVHALRGKEEHERYDYDSPGKPKKKKVTDPGRAEIILTSVLIKDSSEFAAMADDFSESDDE